MLIVTRVRRVIPGSSVYLISDNIRPENKVFTVVEIYSYGVFQRGGKHRVGCGRLGWEQAQIMSVREYQRGWSI